MYSVYNTVVEDPQVQAMARPLLTGSHATPTPPKCRPGAHRAPINNLSILLPPILLFFSCAVVSVFLFGGKANLVQFTLFYSTLLTLTDGRNYRQRNELILCGLGNQKKLVPPG